MKENHLPEGWEEVKFGEIIKLQNGYAFKSNDFCEKGTPVIRISDIEQGIVTCKNAVCINNSNIPDDFHVNEGDILIAMSGATTGKYGIYNGKETLYLNQRVGSFKVLNDSKTIKKFIYYVLGAFQKEIVDNAYGGAQPNISSKIIEGLKIPLPPLSEQERIVAKLDRLMGHIHTLKTRLSRIPTLLRDFRQSILNKAVTGELTEDWRQGKDLEEWKDSVKLESEIPFDIPNSWEWTNFTKIGELTRGKSKHRPRNDSRLFGGNYPFIQTGDIARAQGIVNDYKVTYSEFGLNQSRLFPKGTLCITIAANIADTAILGFEACFPDSVVGFIPNSKLCLASFIMYYIQVIKDEIEHLAPATAQKNINIQILNNINIPLPTLSEQEEIVRRVESLFAKADALEAAYERLRSSIEALPQSILSKAFRGEL